MDSQRRLANPLSAPRALDTQHAHACTHTHTQRSATSSLLQSMKDEKAVSVRVLILKSRVF